MINRGKFSALKRLISVLLSVCITLTVITSAIPSSLHIHALVCGNQYEDCFEDYVAGQTTYTIHNAASYNKFRELVNSGTDFTGVTITMRNNIFSPKLTGPIGTEEHPFNGILDGNGLELSDTVFNDSTLKYNGVFGYVGASGVIKNLIVRDCSFTGGEYCGAVAGRCDGVIENCGVSNITVSGTKYVGTLAGRSKSDISGKTATGSVTLTGSDGYAGGMVGYLEGSIINCGSSASVTVTGSSHGGGIVGYLSGTAVNSYASGDVIGNSSAKCGGFAGITAGKCQNCYAAGDVTGSVAAGFSAECRGLLDGCFWNSTEVSQGVGVSVSETSATAKTASELASDAMVNTLNSRALNILNALGWTGDEDNVNGGFPILTENAAGFGGGDGSAENPFLISSAGQLKLLSSLVETKNDEYASLCYKMTADITFNSAVTDNIASIGFWDGLSEYGSTGDTTIYFSGVFDGGGYTISGINISQGITNNSYSLFSALAPSACIMNLNVVNHTIISNVTSGAIAATNYGTIKNCSVNANITVSVGSSGGITGMNYGSIINCISRTTQRSAGTSTNPGGIAGSNYPGGRIINCFSDSTFTALGAYGGLCGKNNTAGAETIIDGYFLEASNITDTCGGTAISAAVVSGAATYADTGKTAAELLNTYALTDASLLLWTNDESGNLCFDYPEITYSCEYGTITSNVKPIPGTEITFTAVANDHFCYLPGSFSATLISGTESGASYTVTAPQTDFTVSASFKLEGDGTEESPFCIYSADNIQYMAECVNSGTNRNSEYVLMNSVTFTADEAAQFVPIGTVSSGFIGHFDGRGNTVSKLIVTKNVTDTSGYLGFFGYVSGGTVENLSVNANLSISASSNLASIELGGIAAHFLSGSINNCAFSGKLTATGGTAAVFAGGISGSASGNIVNCSNAGTISSTGCAGGLVGTGSNCTIWNSYNRGAIINSQYGGGIIGYASDDSLENCYSCADVSGTNVGAIAGYSETATLFMNCTYSNEMFDGNGTFGYTDEDTGIDALSTQTMKTVTFSKVLNSNAENPMLDSVKNMTDEPSEWMQNSVTAAGCPAFMWQKINVVRNAVTSTEYWDLQMAVDASAGAELMLLASNAPSYTLTVASGKTLFLSMAKMTLTCQISNAGASAFSNGTLNSNISNTGSLTLTDVQVSGSGALTSDGSLSIGGSTSVTATGGIVLQSGYIGVESALTAQSVAAISSDFLKKGDEAVKGVSFTLSDEYSGKFTLKNSGALEYYEPLNALVVCSVPNAAITQSKASVYDAEAIAEGTDFTLTRDGNGVATYSFCEGEEYTASSVWTAGLPVNAGTYVIRADIAADTSNNLLAGRAYGVVLISKAELSVYADNKAVVYLSDPPEYTYSASGFKGKDNASVISGAADFSCSYVKGSELGKYDILLDASHLSADNYTISASNGTLTVSKLLVKVTFVANNKVIDTQEVEYGGSATTPALVNIPEIVGHTFDSWDKSFDNVKSDLTVTAVYKINTYTVKFVMPDGTELETQTVEYGKSATEPTNIPKKTDTIFDSWDKSFDNVTSDLTVTAQYKIKTFTVRFITFEGDEFDTQIVEYGKAATEPTDIPEIDGYTFAEWDGLFDNITADLTITALYTINTYTVIFVMPDGSEIETQTVEYGKAATEPEVVTEIVGHSFTGWDKTFDKVTEDMTVTAVFEKNTYTVKFVMPDGSEIETQTVEYGKAAVAPTEIPQIAEQTFTGWDKSFDNVMSDLTVTAKFALKGYTVKFVDYDGKLLLITGAEPGKSVTPPATNPERTGYTFSGWDKSLDNITSDTIITAQYTINSYTVRFVDYDDTLLSEQIVEYGSDATAPEVLPTRTGYDFGTWDKSLENISEDTEIKAVYNPKHYVIRFVDYEGNELFTQSVAYSEAATAPTPPEREGYDFTGWSEDFSCIKEAITIVTQYTIKSFEVNFCDYDGSLLNVQKVEYGKSPVLPANPERTGYTFTKWDLDTTSVIADMTVTAQYTVNFYTVIFVDYDGEELKTESVEYSTAATAPEAPTRKGYSFVDWNRSFSSVSADITVVAVYEILPDKITYNVTFVDYDDKVLSVCEVEYWATATAPEEPSRSGYTFIGWDTDFTSVNRDITVKAQYELSIATAAFTVIFTNYDGTVLSVQNVESGKAAQAPENPERYGYKFIGWDKDFTNIKSYLTVTAMYELEDTDTLFTVIFKNYDGTVLSKEVVKYLDSAVPPVPPEREGYIFTGWDKSCSEVADNITVTAQYELVKFAVVFFDHDGTVLDEQLVSYGNTAIYPDEPQREGYTFTGWDTDFTRVTQELTITALYKINSYTVTFYDYDSTVIDIQTIEYGSAAVAPSVPARENYTFIGWSTDFTSVTASLSVVAQYKIYSFTVTFKDYDGKVLVVRDVPYGGIAEAPEVTAREGFVFIGWDNSLKNITSDKVITAQYKADDGKKAYTVTFCGIDGSTLLIRYVIQGEGAVAPVPPEITGYIFDGWDKDFSSVTEDMTVNAQYKLNSPDMYFTVIFLDYDNTIISTQSVRSGEDAVAPEEPSRNGYSFTGWDKEFTDVVADIIVKAKYAAVLYTVRFVDHDGSVIDEQLVEYGGAATEPAQPSREEYIFKGWDVAFDYITGDMIVKAVYIMNITGVYTVTFIGLNGTVLKTEYVLEGDEATAPNVTETEGYTFIGWDKPYDSIVSDLSVNAVFNALHYTVTFCDYNGSVLSVQKIAYGKSAIAPTVQTRNGYTFTGWDTTFSVVVSDITVKAVYQIKKFNVVFVDLKGVIISVQQIEFGSDAKPPEAPAVEGMTFIGWDTSFINVSENLTITSVYADTTQYGKATVIFVDYDGTVLGVEYVTFGENATAPENPQRAGYKFIGWDKNFENVTQNMRITAIYEISELPLYNVTFVDYDGKTISSQSVKHGASAVAPAVPERVGYVFTGWSGSYGEITSDTIITAKYNPCSYTVTFLSYDSTVISAQTVEYLSAVREPEAPKREGYTFTGWSHSFDSITSDMLITAQYKANMYEVVFKGFDGRTLKTQQVAYLGSAEAPVPPEINKYDFVRWDTSFSSVTKNITVTAIYERSKLTVTFCDYDGSIISVQEVAYGGTATAPADPVRAGHTFNGWDMDFDVVVSDLFITADYSKIRYNVRFLDWDGRVISSQTAFYLKPVIAPVSPKRTGYTFMGWDSTFDAISSDMDIYALYNPLTFEVSFVDFNSTVISIQHVEYMKAAEAPLLAEISGYTFKGWDKDFSSVQADMTVKAQYERSVCVVTFLNWDSTVLSEQTVEYRGEASEPSVPEREGYTFSGWDKDFTSVTSNITVNALYAAKIYRVSFLDSENGTLIGKVSTEYGTEAISPEAPPAIDGKVFVGWSEDVSFVKGDMEVYPLYEDIPETSIGFETVITEPEMILEIPVTASCPWRFTSLTVTVRWDSRYLNLIGLKQELPCEYTRIESGAIMTVTPESEISGDVVLFTMKMFLCGVNDLSLLEGIKVEIEPVSGTDADGNKLSFGECGGVIVPTEIDSEIGDVSLDGRIDSKDAFMILQWCVSITKFNETQLLLGDVNGDGVISPRDAFLLLLSVAEV